MCRNPAARLLPASVASLFIAAVVALVAQAPAPAQTPAEARSQPSGSAAISVEEEHHHHLVFENSYVKVFYVEVPAHESTLYHRHDLPYVSLPPPPLAGEPSARPASAPPMPPGPRVGYAAGGFSHIVTNRGDAPLRNIAIELLRPQGTARNLCAEVLRGQPLGNCVTPGKGSSESEGVVSSVRTLFETGEIRIDEWEISPGSTVTPADARMSALVGGMRGIADVTGGGDSRMVPAAGVIWLLAGSKATLTAAPDANGRFIAIRFKDSAPAESGR